MQNQKFEKKFLFLNNNSSSFLFMMKKVYWRYIINVGILWQNFDNIGSPIECGQFGISSKFKKKKKIADMVNVNSWNCTVAHVIWLEISFDFLLYRSLKFIPMQLQKAFCRSHHRFYRWIQEFVDWNFWYQGDLLDWRNFSIILNSHIVNLNVIKAFFMEIRKKLFW